MPSRTISLPGVRDSGGITGPIGQAINATYCAPTGTRGWYYAPFRLPADFDVTRPADLQVLLYPATAAWDTQAVVALKLTTTTVENARLAIDSVLRQDWTTPDPIDYFGAVILPFTGDQPNTYPARFFTPNEYVGLLFQRDGSRASDTYASSLGIAATLTLTYQGRCSFQV